MGITSFVPERHFIELHEEYYTVIFQSVKQVKIRILIDFTYFKGT